ncbi:MAG TPA: DHA2 family efflux MFS transporter permease subunit [Anaerolineae bacterium]|jgi:EmrB/QacA subfamily drug resistance transporter|nr:DHA2 family efflux MFS transporter permease subunit [Anaerolineae bacterium]
MREQQIDYSRKWLVLAAVGTGIFLSTVDASIVNVALPTLSRSFDSSFAVVQWVVLAYLLTISTLLLSVGRLGDMIGKKPIYATGFVVFTIGSMLCGVAPTVYWLIAFRVVQGLGAVMIVALGLAILTEAFPANERGKALGIGGATVSVGIVVGPVLGGLLLGAFSWRWIFYVNVPVGIAGTLLTLRYVPGLKPAGGQRFDLLGGITLFISLFSLLMALTWGQDLGFFDRRVLLLLAGAAVFGVVFVVVESRVKQPMIDLRLFRDGQFSVGLVTGFVTFVAIAGTTLLLPFYLENVLGYEPRQVGLLLAVVPISLGITAPISGTLSDRFGTRLITVIGLAVLVLGYYALSTLNVETGAVVFVLLFLPIGIGMGIFQSPNNSAILGSAPQGRLGIVSGTLAATRTIGQTAGIALLGALWAGRTLYYAGSALAAGATEASSEAQAAALQDTFLVTTALVAAALLLAVVAWLRGRNVRDLTAAEAGSSA